VGLFIVLAIRLTAPLTILRWPFAGSLIAIAADAVDIIVFQLTDFPSIGYHRFDKMLDVYYLALEAFVAQRWAPTPRWTASALFLHRVTGVALYELTDIRVLLLVFPNLLEFFFVVVAGAQRFRPDYAFTPRRTAVWLGVLLVPKMAQEYTLHYAKWLDKLVAVEIIEDGAGATWHWLRDLPPWR
jgi:hypothetical protein